MTHALDCVKNLEFGSNPTLADFDYCVVMHSLKILEYSIPYTQLNQFIPNLKETIKSIIGILAKSKSNLIQNMIFNILKSATSKSNIGTYSIIIPFTFNILIFVYYKKVKTLFTDDIMMELILLLDCDVSRVYSSKLHIYSK